MSFSIPAPVKRRRRARFFRKVVAQSYPTRIIIQFSRYSKEVLSLIPTEKRQVASLNQKNIWEFEKSFHLFPLGRAKLSGVFEKFFVLQNTPSLIWTKGLKCTPISGLFLENFFEKNFTLHLFGIEKSKRTLFSQKIWKIFCVRLWDSLFLLV